MLDVATEQVLVVPTEIFHQLGHFQGFSHEAQRYLDALLQPQHVSYRPRQEMEADPSFKQLIPYVVLHYRDPIGQSHVFQYTRGKGQGEGRLHSKRSVGIGGHISIHDAAENRSGDPYEEGLRRELDEEVEIRSAYRARRAGLINDDLTEVGRVHLGVVHIFDLDQPDVLPREADILEAGFTPIADLLANLDGFETWSRITLEALFGPQCSGHDPA